MPGPKYCYEISICLKPYGTFKLRKILHNSGFMILLRNLRTGETHSLIEDYDADETFALDYDDKAIEFYCVFNHFSDSELSPSEEELVLDIKTGYPGKVNDYSIRRRFFRPVN